jgi:hypothetical protein
MKSAGVSNGRGPLIPDRDLMGAFASSGALFGVILTLPFGFEDFLDFVVELRSSGATDSSIGSGEATQSVLLLLPFVVGFSTPLVIMIPNQFVEAVQRFFGKKTVVVQSSHGRPLHLWRRPLRHLILRVLERSHHVLNV